MVVNEMANESLDSNRAPRGEEFPPHGPTTGKKYGADLVVDMLLQYDIRYVALNPGSSFRGLHDSLVNYGGNKAEILLCPHEEIAVQIAHGYAKASGKPMAAIVHDVVGLLHCCMAVYYSYIDRAPVLLLGATGPLNEARRRPHIDWIHTANVQGNAVRDFTKWDDQPASVDGIPESFARAYRVALTEPQGPVYVCYDAQLQEDPISHDVETVDPSAARVPTRMAPDPEALKRVAEVLINAQRPAVLVEYAGRDPAFMGHLIRLAEMLALPVFDLHGRLNFPTNHPLNMTDTDIFRTADVILTLDVRDYERTTVVLDKITRTVKRIVPDDCQFLDIGFQDLEISSWSLDYGRYQETAISILADTSLAVPQLTTLVEERLQASGDQHGGRIEARREDVTRRHNEARQRWLAEAKEDWDASPMTTGRLALEVWDAIKNEDWVLSAGTLKEWTPKLWDYDTPYRHPGKELGTATQIGISLGVALAHKGTGRLVVDIQPDGDLMFDPGALWVAAKYQIPFLVVMYNNRAYYNDWEHQIRMANLRGTPWQRANIGMDLRDPGPDFAGMARSMGWYAEGPVEDPNEVAGALQRAIAQVKAGKPALVDTITRYR